MRALGGGKGGRGCWVVGANGAAGAWQTHISLWSATESVNQMICECKYDKYVLCW